MTTVEETSPVSVTKGSARGAAAQEAVRRVSRPLAVLRSQPHAPTYAGVLLATVGAVLLAVAWGKTAGTTVVSQQVPYVVSAGFVGLALVAVGLTVINLAAKVRDGQERTRQLTELREVLVEMRRAVEAESAPAAPPARPRVAATPVPRDQLDSHDAFQAPRSRRAQS